MNDKKAVISDITVQLLLALLTALVTASVMPVFGLFLDDGINVFISSLFAMPLVTFVCVSVSLIFLKEYDIYIPIVFAAVILGAVYLFLRFGTAYMGFAVLELISLLMGRMSGKYFRKRRKSK